MGKSNTMHTKTTNKYATNKTKTNTNKLSSKAQSNKARTNKITKKTVKLPKQTKLQRLASNQYKNRLKGNFIKEQYTSFARRINTRLKQIEKAYGTDSKLYQQYVTQFDKLVGNIVMYREDGSVSLRTGKKAFEDVLNAPKNKLGLNSAVQYLNRANSIDSLAMRNERTRVALDELGVDYSQIDEKELNAYLKEKSEMFNEMGVYITEHYEDVLYIDGKAKDTPSQEIINILKKEENTIEEIEKAYEFIKKEKAKIKTDKAHQKRVETHKRLESKRVKG